MHSISSVFSNFMLYDRVRDCGVEHGGTYGMCEHICTCMDRDGV